MTALKKLGVVSMCHDLIQESDFFRFVDSLKKVGLNYGLVFHPVAVTSSFGKNNRVNTKYGVDIRLVDYQEMLGVECYDQLAKAFGSNQINSGLRLAFGYGLRTIDFQNNNASIITGSHSPLTNEIMFDVPTYKFLDKETMRHRLGHEMLHEFGLDEREVLSKEDDYYQEIRNIEIKPLSSLYQRIQQANIELESRVGQLFSECYYQQKLLEGFVEELNPKLVRMMGVSIDLLIEAKIDSVHPITKGKVTLNLF